MKTTTTLLGLLSFATLTAAGWTTFDDVSQSRASREEKAKQQVTLPWDGVKPFSEGWARVKRGNKWGYIDKRGRITVEPKWDAAGDIVEGLGPVKKGNKWGFIDQTGEIAIGFRWDGVLHPLPSPADRRPESGGRKRNFFGASQSPEKRGWRSLD